MAEVVDLGKARRAKCPICGKPNSPEHRPFCSARCKQVDLGRWLGGTYRVQTEEVPDEEDLAAMAQEVMQGRGERDD